MNDKRAIIKYFTLPDEMRRSEKLDWFAAHRFQDIAFETITPDENGNWINLTDNDFDTLLPLVNKKTKAAKSQAQEQAVFKLFASSIKTNRDEWVYDFDKDTLEKKMERFTGIYNEEVHKLSVFKDIPSINNLLNYSIKWSRDLKNELLRNRKAIFSREKISLSNWRPFTRKYFYSEFIFSDVLSKV